VEHTLEGEDRAPLRTHKATRGGIHGDEVHVEAGPSKQAGEFRCGFLGVVHATDEGVFEGDPAASFPEETLRG